MSRPLVGLPKACLSGLLSCLCALPILLTVVATSAHAQQADTPEDRGFLGPSRPSQATRPDGSVTPNAGDALATEQSPAIQNQDASFEADNDPLEINPPTQERPGSRPIIQDGDLSYPRTRAQPRDGVIEVGEPTPLLDGSDARRTVTRSRSVIDLFECQPG